MLYLQDLVPVSEVCEEPAYKGGKRPHVPVRGQDELLDGQDVLDEASERRQRDEEVGGGLLRPGLGGRGDGGDGAGQQEVQGEGQGEHQGVEDEEGGLPGAGPPGRGREIYKAK